MKSEKHLALPIINCSHTQCNHAGSGVPQRYLNQTLLFSFSHFPLHAGSGVVKPT